MVVVMMRGVRRGRGRVMIEVSGLVSVDFFLTSFLGYWPEYAHGMLHKSLDPWGCRLDGVRLMAIRSVW